MRALLMPLALLAAVPAGAQTACPAGPGPIPAELSGWSAAVPVTAAKTVQELGLATLRIGRGASATLSPAVIYPVAPDHAPAPGTQGGLFAFAVTEAGTYRVAIGGGLWIDVVRDGHAVASIAHGHGPACSPVKKMVDFALQPGRYILQVSGGSAPTLPLIVARLPA